MKFLKYVYVFLSILIIVAIPLIYRAVYVKIAHFTVKGVVSTNVVSIAPAYVSGYIKKIYAKKSQRVSKGQLLALIDDTLYKGILNVDKSKVDMLKSKINNLSAQLYNSDREKPNQVIRNDIESSERQYVIEREKLKLQRIKLSYTRITSPIDGIVLDNVLRKGDYAEPGKVIMHIYKSKNIFISACLKPKQLKYFHLGKTVNLKKYALSKELHGTIADIGYFGYRCTDPNLVPVKINIADSIKKIFYLGELIDITIVK